MYMRAEVGVGGAVMNWTSLLPVLWGLIVEYLGSYRLVLRMTGRWARTLIPHQDPSQARAPSNLLLLREICQRGDTNLLAWWTFHLPSCMEYLSRWSQAIVNGGHVPILRWALQHPSFRWDAFCTLRAATEGRVDLLEMAHGRGRGEMFLMDIASGNNPTSLRWYRDMCNRERICVGVDSVRATISHVTTRPHEREVLSILQTWLTELSCPTEPPDDDDWGAVSCR